MAVLTYSELSTLVKNLLVINTSTDAPVGATELLEAINDAYKTVWEMAGGAGIKQVGAPSAWATESTAVGLAYGLLTDIKEVLALYSSTTAPQTLSTVTNGTTTLTSAALFGNVTRGMHITGTGIAANTFVVSVESTSSLTMSQIATDSTTNNRTFADTGESTTAKLMEPAEFGLVQWMKKGDLPGTYARPKMYSLTRLEAQSPAAATAATTNLLRLDYWPAVTGFYFPMTYVPQFTPLDGGTSDTPTVNDIESYDIAYLAAMDLAPRIGRQSLMEGIAMKVSDTTRAALDRKLKAMVSPDQDDAARG